MRTGKKKESAALFIAVLFLAGCGQTPEETESQAELSPTPAFVQNLTEGTGDETGASDATGVTGESSETGASNEAVESNATGGTAPAATTTGATAPSSPKPASTNTTATGATTEAVTEPPAWQDPYRKLLAKTYVNSERKDAYFALIPLNADEVPELVIMDGTAMALYCFDGKEVTLLMEDSYKDIAAAGQNVCFQPMKGLFASAFENMGGGSGFNIYQYEKLNTVDVERYLFDNNEDEGGELPYNPLWDKAEDFGVINGGYHKVSLSAAWQHIGTSYPECHALTAENAQRAGEGWSLKGALGAAPTEAAE